MGLTWEEARHKGNVEVSPSRSTRAHGRGLNRDHGKYNTIIIICIFQQNRNRK